MSHRKPRKMRVFEWERLIKKSHLNTPGVPIISRNCQNELARLSYALCPLSATPLAIHME